MPIDLPPSVELYLPSRPAIIRAGEVWKEALHQSLALQGCNRFTRRAIVSQIEKYATGVQIDAINRVATRSNGDFLTALREIGIDRAMPILGAFAAASVRGVRTPNLVNPLNGSTGGTITEESGYRVHRFTSGGTFTPSADGTVEVYVIGGGGGGSNYGGGGAGGVESNSAYAVTNASGITVTVGDGGAGGTTGSNGSNSVFGSITANGGGRGGVSNAGAGANGGSGGGGSYNSGAGGSATATTGNAGGTGYPGAASPFAAGGGGGASAAGVNGLSTVGGPGGSGITIWGSDYAGGGGGGHNSGAGGNAPGGLGGGGTGGKNGSGMTAGTANTGGGGGGYGNTSFAGAAGGSGIVMVRYPLTL